jgi:signal transduction histidine kinase
MIAIQRPRSIRRQLIVTVTGVHMILMVSFVYDMVERQQAFVVDRARARAMSQAEVLATSATPYLITNDLSGIQDIIGSMKRDPSLRWTSVTDDKGLVLGDSNLLRRGKFFTGQPEMSVMVGPARAVVVHQSGTDIATAAPVIAGSKTIGGAWVSRDLAPEQHQIRALRRTGWIYTVIAVLSGAVLAVVLASGITRQLRLLLLGTRRLAADKLDQPVPVIANTDVGDVARAFNEAMEKLRTERERLQAEIRERRRAEEELRSANRAITSANEGLNQFAYAASHDLQEPLRGILAYSELLSRDYQHVLDDDGKEFLGYVHHGAERMQSLLKGLLEYSRATTSTGGQAAQVDTNAALQIATENLATAIETSGARVIPSQLPVVTAHEVAIVQIFQNLIGNAIKYAGVPEIEIRISAEAAGPEWVFTVADNGVGIAPAHHKRIFGIFKRAHGDEHPGTGVGLAICSKIVERYGGRIWVESEPGKGARFRFTLPSDPARV